MYMDNYSRRRNNDRRTWVYVLGLEQGKYYVGKTRNVQLRYKQHVAGGLEGSEWTKIYKVERIVHVSVLKHSLDEDAKVKEMMMEHGIENVRGGSYSNIELTMSQKDVLRREIVHAQDKCLKCKQYGHFARQCTSNTSDRKKSIGNNVECTRCCRLGHVDKSCNYRIRSDGKFICESFLTGSCGIKCSRLVPVAGTMCIQHCRMFNK